MRLQQHLPCLQEVPQRVLGRRGERFHWPRCVHVQLRLLLGHGAAQPAVCQVPRGYSRPACGLVSRGARPTSPACGLLARRALRRLPRAHIPLDRAGVPGRHTQPVRGAAVRERARVLLGEHRLAAGLRDARVGLPAGEQREQLDSVGSVVARSPALPRSCRGAALACCTDRRRHGSLRHPIWNSAERGGDGRHKRKQRQAARTTTSSLGRAGRRRGGATGTA